jgi:teichuronic acid biosynthesis glycosyltransferase TuaC
MTILVLSFMFPNDRDSSSGIFVLEQIKALRKAGVTVLVVSPTPWAPRLLKFLPSVRKYAGARPHFIVDELIVDRPRVLTLPKNLGFAWSGLLSYISCRRLLAKKMRQTKIDLIHAHGILPDGFAAVLLGREFHVPVVCTAHGSDVNVYPFMNQFVRWASRWALRRIDGMITVSESLKTGAIALAGARDISVVHNGAESEIFRAVEKGEARSRLKLNAPNKLVCFVGYLRPEKGLEYLLEAFAVLGRSDTQLCVVGDGPLKETLIAQAERLGILNNCRFVGNQPHKEIPLWLSAADCLVLCSLSEGFPTVLPEAMLCHVPIIATPVGGTPEMIHQGETGLLVPCRDATALSEALNSLLSNAQLASGIADRAEALARASLTWSVNAKQTMDVYADVLRVFELANSENQRFAELHSVQGGSGH